MKDNRKKLIDDYKNQMPKMGVLKIYSKSSGDMFLGVCKDLRVGINSNKAKLSFNNHPNKELQELWNKHGSDDFIIELIKEFEYVDKSKDYTDELEILFELTMLENNNAKKIWK